MRVRTGTIVLCCSLLSLSLAVSAGEKRPEQRQGRPTQNLQVLPKDWTTAQVQPVMTGIARSLGVQCTYCHEMDRSADTKPQKLVGRRMLQMTMAINREYLEGVGEPVPAGEDRVTCYTCHRGELKPPVAPPSGGGV